MDLLANRKPFIAGNWKLNPETKAEAVKLAKDIAASVSAGSPGDVSLFVPFPFIEAVQSAVGDKISVGAEVSRNRKSFDVLFVMQGSHKILSNKDDHTRDPWGIYWSNFSPYASKYGHSVVTSGSLRTPNYFQRNR
jgi:hypothetical protein